MKYLLTIYGDESRWADLTKEDGAQLMAAYEAFGREAGEAGVLVGGEGLQPTATATTVRVRDGERLLTDGPFAETREQLGGYYLLDCGNLDDAIGWAAKIPDAATGSVEVRPVMDYEAQGAESPNHDAAARG
ncbi:MAG: YciI family protein [Solirubrobacteraceae bacterium]